MEKASGRMNHNITKLSGSLDGARVRCAADLKALEEVRGLLAKADERRLREPEEARKWNQVLEKLEKSLDLTKARYEQSERDVRRLEQEIRDLGGSPDVVVSPLSGDGSSSESQDEDPWRSTLRQVESLNLEQASQLQCKIDSGEIQDERLEAGLALANQMQAKVPEPEGGVESRRQLVLRRAIDKIGKRRYDLLSLDEINVVLACHSLLTSRLEPTPRDKRLRRILDGAIKILQRRKVEMENRLP